MQIAKLMHFVFGLCLVAWVTQSSFGQTVVTGSYIGSPGAGTYAGEQVPDQPGLTYYGESGSYGYQTNPSPIAYIFQGATVVGGAGATNVALDRSTNLANTYIAGAGATGAFTYTSFVTFVSGSFTGGTGGSISGAGSLAQAGAGGDGLNNFSGYGGQDINIQGGLFCGGASGLNTAVQRQFSEQVLTSSGDGAFFYGGTNSNPNYVDITGGTFDGAGGGDGTGIAGNGLVNDGATVTVYGGTFNGGPTGYFGPGYGIEAYSAVNIIGNNFEVDGIPVGYGGLFLSSGTLTGTLEDNSGPTSITYSGNVFVWEAPVPEPSLLGPIALVGGLLARRLKRRHSLSLKKTKTVFPVDSSYHHQHQENLLKSVSQQQFGQLCYCGH